MDESWFSDLLDAYKDDPDFITDQLVLDITEQVATRMGNLGMRPVNLATTLGVSRAFISQLMNGRPNMTLRTLVGVALALDQRVSIRLEPQQAPPREMSAYARTWRGAAGSDSPAV